MRRKLTAARSEANRLSEELQSKEEAIVELKRRLKEAERRAKELEDRVAEEVRARKEVLDRLTRLEAEQRDKAAKEERERYMLVWLALPALLILVGVILAWRAGGVSIWPVGQIGGRPLIVLLLVEYKYSGLAGGG